MTKPKTAEENTIEFIDNKDIRKWFVETTDGNTINLTDLLQEHTKQKLQAAADKINNLGEIDKHYTFDGHGGWTTWIRKDKILEIYDEQ